MDTALVFIFGIYIYNDNNRFVVSWWGIDSYFNHEQIQTRYAVLMNYTYVTSGSFESRVRSKYIEHNTYSGRGSNFCSKPTPIHGPVHKYDFIFSYSRSHFIQLPQAVSKRLMNILSQKVSYAYIMIDPVINWLSPNEEKIQLKICDHSIITFFIRGLCLGVQNFSCTA